MVRTPVKSAISIFKIFLFTGGLLTFAGFSHQSVLSVIISLTGLLISASIIVIEIRTVRNFYTLFGWHRLSKKNIYFLPVCLAVGILFGVAYRDYLNVFFIPLKLTAFAVVAAAIGSTEELLFRGYLQSQIRNFNVMLSIFAATCAHTAYKFLLFLPYNPEPDIEITFIIQWTLLGGFVFALIKEFSQNTVYPVLSHALFDLLVYGDKMVTPWWVWA